MQTKNYKDYQEKVNEEGKKALQLMQSKPLSPAESIEMFKKNKELAIRMRMERLNK